MKDSWRWAPGAIWIAIIFVATSIPGSAFPSVAVVPGADKFVHAFLYSVLGFLLARSSRPVPGGNERSLIAVLCAIAVLAALDEWHQQWIPGRRADVTDWLADMAGAVAGVTLWLTALARRETTT